MATGRPTTVYLWELAWILPSFAIPVGMLAALAVTALGTGITVTGDQGQIEPRKLAEHPLFKEPLGLRVAASRRVPQPAAEFADALSGWLALTALMIAVAYGPTLVRLIATTPLSTPGFRVW